MDTTVFDVELANRGHPRPAHLGDQRYPDSAHIAECRRFSASFSSCVFHNSFALARCTAWLLSRDNLHLVCCKLASSLSRYLVLSVKHMALASNLNHLASPSVPEPRRRTAARASLLKVRCAPFAVKTACALFRDMIECVVSPPLARNYHDICGSAKRDTKTHRFPTCSFSSSA